jgi:hypothetical protein
MDREISYLGAIPELDTVLYGQRNAMLALGYLAQAVLGTSTLFDGLLCTASGLGVSVAPGSVLQLEVIDTSPYSDIAASSDPVVKQGINTAPTVFQTPAPATPGQSVIYVVAGAFLESDTNDTVIPYFNAANMNAPQAGPGNSGASQPTRRQQRCDLRVYAGAPAASPVAPGVDAGYQELWVITVPAGVTAVTPQMITQANSAPFIGTKLPGLAPLLSPAFQGAPTAPAPAAGDRSSRIPTTAWVGGELVAGKVGYQGTAAGTVATNVGAKISSWEDLVADYAADPTGAADSTAAINAFFAGTMAERKLGRLPSGHFKVTGPQLVIDLEAVAQSGIMYQGAGANSTIIDVTACTASPQVIIKCSSNAAFYSTFSGIGFETNTAGVGLQIGQDFNSGANAFPDAMNFFLFEQMTVENAGTGAALKVNGVLNSIVNIIANGPGTGTGTAYEIAGAQFSTFGGGSGNCATGIHFVDQGAYGCEFIGFDNELSTNCIICDSANQGNNTWLGGQYQWTAGQSPVILNACGGVQIFVGGNPATGIPSITGAAAGHGTWIGYGIGGLTLGSVLIAPAAADAAVVVNAPVGYGGYQNFLRANSIMWQVGFDNVNNYQVVRYSETGAPVDTPLAIVQATGEVLVNKLAVAGNFGTNGMGAIAPPVISGGSRTTNTAQVVASIINCLTAYGLATDTTTA